MSGFPNTSVLEINSTSRIFVTLMEESHNAATRHARTGKSSFSNRPCPFFRSFMYHPNHVDVLLCLVDTSRLLSSPVTCLFRACWSLTEIRFSLQNGRTLGDEVKPIEQTGCWIQTVYSCHVWSSVDEVRWAFHDPKDSWPRTRLHSNAHHAYCPTHPSSAP